MPFPRGYAIGVDPDTGGTIERDVFRCCHCQRLTELMPGGPANVHWCLQCAAPTCDQPPCLSACVPWERAMERQEAAARLMAALR